MAKISKIPETRIPFNSAMFNILMALAGGEKHGFAILLEIEAFSNREVALGPGTLFSSIKRLLEAGLIEQSNERIDPDLDDQRRQYYRITGLGQQLLEGDLNRKFTQPRVTHAKDFLSSSVPGGAG